MPISIRGFATAEMATTHASSLHVSAAKPQATPSLSTLAWRRFRRHRLALLGGTLLSIIVGVCLVGPLLVPESAANRVDPTLFRAPPSLAHPFGSDDVGRDILWRIVY